MSCPDLKMLIQSLFYQNQLFTMKEQEDCRETSDNLFYTIEYLHHLVRFALFLIIEFVHFEMNSFSLME